MKISFIFGFLMIFASEKIDNELSNDLLCKREIVENYDISSYYSPKKENFYLCPRIENACCSMYD